MTDGGTSFKEQAKGCGLMTGWGFGSSNSIETDGSSAGIGRYETQYWSEFNLPATFKDGCVGRAIASAGGPNGVHC
jgi:hypothetical protein